MKYFKTTFVWIIVLAGIAGYYFIDFKKTAIETQKKEEATKLLPFPSEQVLSMTISKEGKELVLERWDKGWKIVAPVNAKASNAAVEKFLKNVMDSRNDAEYVMDPNPTKERLEEFGLANPSVKLTLKVGKDLKAHTILFGNRAPTMGIAYAQLEGQIPVYRVLADARAEADKDVYYFRDKSVLRMNPVMIDQVSVVRPDGSILAKLPEDGKWEIVKPVQARADAKRVFDLLGAFANGEIKEFVSEKKENLAEWGLQKPDITLSFWISGDSEPVRIDIGSRTAEKRGYFCAMSDRDGIFVLDEKAINFIPRKAEDLRNRELFFFEAEKLTKMEFKSREKNVVLVKDPDKEWRKGGIKGDKIDFNALMELLNELKKFEIKDFVSGDIRAMGGYGLDPGEMQVSLWSEDSKIPVTLAIGKAAPSGYVYAFSSSENMVLALEDKVKRVLQNYFDEI